MDDNWADIFTDAEAHAAEYSDTDFDDSRTDYDQAEDLEEEDEVGPAIQYERTQHLRNNMTGRLVDKIQIIDSMARRYRSAHVVDIVMFRDFVTRWVRHGGKCTRR
jgi:hypothetical protein